MNVSYSVSLATALLRVSLGVMFVAHSLVLKYFVYTLDGTVEYFVSIGLPGLLAYVVFLAELVGGTLLILGIATRFTAAALVPILLGAVWAHSGNGWVFSNQNGGWEYPLYLAVLAIAQSLLGGGAFALSSSRLNARTRPVGHDLAGNATSP
jgi:putative oxidoreductase